MGGRIGGVRLTQIGLTAGGSAATSVCMGGVAGTQLTDHIGIQTAVSSRLRCESWVWCGSGPRWSGGVSAPFGA